MSKQIAFLTYLSRSGSTLLAKKLNAFKDIAVSIEAVLIEEEKIIGFSINSEKDLDKVILKLYNQIDKKFQKWNIDKNLLKEKLYKFDYPIKIGDFFRTIFELFFEGNQAKVLMYKNAHMSFHTEAIWKELPEAKFLFIDRDPRAVYNSQKKSFGSYTNKPIQSDIVDFARVYKDRQEKIQRINDKNRFFILKYEDLITNDEKILGEILSFLGVSNELRETNDYFAQIPEEQKHLHQNLKESKNKIERMNAWQNELSGFEISFLQKTLRKELDLKGYSIHKVPNMGFVGKFRVLQYSLGYFFYYSFRRFLLKNIPFLYKIITSISFFSKPKRLKLTKAIKSTTL